MYSERAIYNENFPHPIHGSMQPIRLGGEADVPPGKTMEEMWEDMYMRAHVWWEKKAREIMANANEGVFSDRDIQWYPQKEDLELEAEIRLFESFPSRQEAEKFLPKSPFKHHPKIKEIISKKL